MQIRRETAKLICQCNTVLFQDLAKERKDFLLKILSGLSDFNGLGKELSGGDREPLKLSQLGERSLYSQPVTRERTPCKNFFWKTFSSC
ncbi:SMS1B protein, partial [Amia calva]|nr:SMS1B protein [Amia calva]